MNDLETLLKCIPESPFKVQLATEIETLTCQRDNLLAALEKTVSKATVNICSHDETHRAESIWEVCDQCGAKWADDEGGKPEFKWPEWVREAESAIASVKENKLK